MSLMTPFLSRSRQCAGVLFFGLLAGSVGATPVAQYSQSFEGGGGMTYTTAPAPFNDSTGNPETDFLGVISNDSSRIDDVDIPTFGIFSAGDGNRIFCGSDTDAPESGVTSGTPAVLTFDPVNISSLANVSLHLLLAANDPSATSAAAGFDQTPTNPDFLEIQVSLDGGVYQTLARYTGDNSFNSGINSFLSQDTDGDDFGDAGISSAPTAIQHFFKEFVYPVSSGTSLQVRLVFLASATSEYIAIDQVQVFGEVPATDPPVLTDVPLSMLNYTEGDAATRVAPGIRVTDSDSTLLDSATVVITSGYIVGEDVLSATASGNVSVSFFAASGTLKLTGIDSPANYETVLRSVNYENQNTINPDPGTRTLTFSAYDGTNLSNTPTRDIDVQNTIQTYAIPHCYGFEVAAGSPGGPQDAYQVTGGFDHSNNDFFRQLHAGDNSARFDIPFSGVIGNGFFGSEDIDGNGLGEASVSVSLDATGMGNLSVDVLLGAEDSGSFEAGDFLIVDYAIDGGAFVPLIEFRPTGGVNAALAEDTNHNGTGDGVALTSTLTNFHLPVPGTGAQLVIRLRASSSSNYEEIAWDELCVNGVAGGSSPVLSGIAPGPVAYPEGIGPVPVGAGATITDSDSANMADATIELTDNFTMGEDVLNVTLAGGIAGSYDPTNGVYSLSGSASKADYAATLASLTYENTNGVNPSEADRTLSVRVNDGASDSNVQTVLIEVEDLLDVITPPFCETFSTEGRGTRYRAENFFETGPDDLFQRTLLPRVNSVLTGINGSNPMVFMGEDVDSLTSDPHRLVFELDSSGFTGLELSLLLAAAPNQFEPSDVLLIEINADGTGYVPLTAFENDGGINTSLSEDTDLNGVGDGDVLGVDFSSHTYALPDAQELLLRITFATSATGEEIALGELCISGTPLPVVPFPVLYYDFDEGGGTNIINHGSLGGFGELAGDGGDERWVAGAPQGFSPAGALELDGENLGTGDAVFTGFTGLELGLSQSDSYTCAAWINFTKAAGDNHVFSQYNAASQVLHNGVRNSRAHLGHWGNDVTGATVLQTGTWYHVVWLYEAGYQRIFVNGVMDVGPAARGPLANVNPVVVGNSGAANWGFQGQLDEVMIFDEALSYVQIQHLAQGGSPVDVLPGDAQTDGIFFTAPFGPGGTWNLYEVIGADQGNPENWYNAEVRASTKANPFGPGVLAGHLPTIETREENYLLTVMCRLRNSWLGLTDDDAVFGGIEAGTDRNGGWVWTSGIPYAYQNWNGGEPNDSGAAGEDAVALLGYSGMWNDSYSSVPGGSQAELQVLLPYVIEWNLALANPVAGVPVPDPVIPQALPGPLGDIGVFGVMSVRDNGALSHIRAASDSILSGAGIRESGTRDAVNAIDPESPNPQTFLFDQPYVGNTPAVDTQIAHVYKGRVQVADPGMYTFGVNADDGFALRIRGQAFSSVSGPLTMIDSFSPDTIFVDRQGPTGPSFGHVMLPAGEYDVDLVTFQDGGASGHELFVVRGTLTAMSETTDWRLVGHPSAGKIAIPGLVDAIFNVTTTTPGGSALNSLADAEAELLVDQNPAKAIWDVIDFIDPDAGGGGGTYAWNNPFDNGAPTVDDNDFAVEVLADVEILEEGDYIFGFRSDDGASLQIMGQTWDSIVHAVNGNSVIVGDMLQHDANTGDSNTRATIHLLAGTYELRGMYWERGGGAHYELYGDSAHVGATRLLGSMPADVIEDPDGLRLVARPDIRILKVGHNAVFGTTDLEWTSEPSLLYRLSRSADLETWMPIPGLIPSAGSVTPAQVIEAPGFPSSVFRVEGF